MRRALSLSARALAAAGVVAGGLTAACDGPDAVPCSPDDYDDVPLQSTPPLPGDGCADPPTPLSALIESGIEARNEAAAATAAELLDPDVVTVVLCGTGSPVPSDRAQSCTAVFAGGRFLLFDAGDGAQRSIEDLDLPFVQMDAVFLTHFHSDHIADLGEVASRGWIQGRTGTLPVYGGPSVERVVDGFNLVYSPDDQYRVAHHGPEVFPDGAIPMEARRIDDASVDGTVVYDEGGVVVRAYPVDHSPIGPALGYRVEYGGRSVGISGDTIDTPGLRALADGADVLVSEVLNHQWALDMACAMERTGDDRIGQTFRDIRTYHIDAGVLGGLADDADVQTLVLTHIVPGLPAAQAEQMFRPLVEAAYGGEVIVGADGDRVTVPVP